MYRADRRNAAGSARILERDLDERGRKKSVVIVATSNESALNRVKGAFLAMAIAEHFVIPDKTSADDGFVYAFRDGPARIGLAVREPRPRAATRRRFFSFCRNCSNALRGESGSITGLFTVLVEAMT